MDGIFTLEGLGQILAALIALGVAFAGFYKFIDGKINKVREKLDKSIKEADEKTDELEKGILKLTMLFDTLSKPMEKFDTMAESLIKIQSNTECLPGLIDQVNDNRNQIGILDSKIKNLEKRQ